MLKYKVGSVLSWTAIGGTITAVRMGFLYEAVAAPIISVLIALGFLLTGLGFMARPTEEEKKEREETFVGY